VQEDVIRKIDYADDEPDEIPQIVPKRP